MWTGTDAMIIRGPTAASEEETQIMMDLSLKLNLAKMLDLHSYGREVLVSYLCEPIDRDFDQYISDVRASLLGSRMTVADAWRGYRRASVSASWPTMAFAPRPRTASTRSGPSRASRRTRSLPRLPTRSSRRIATPSVRPSACGRWSRCATSTFYAAADIRKKSFLETPAPLGGHVTLNGEPVDAKILIEDWDIEWHSEGAFGRYHIFLPNGALLGRVAA